jgi:hypothetical protein
VREDEALWAGTMQSGDIFTAQGANGLLILLLISSAHDRPRTAANGTDPASDESSRTTPSRQHRCFLFMKGKDITIPKGHGNLVATVYFNKGEPCSTTNSTTRKVSLLKMTP